MDRFMKRFFSDFDSFFNNDFDSFFNQPLNILGETKTEKGQDSNGEWTKKTFTSKDGSYKMTTFYRSNSSNANKTKTSSKLETLKAELEACVEKQDFEKAVKLRDKIKSIESNKEKITSLKKELEKAISEQNFEKAIELRDALKEIE